MNFQNNVAMGVPTLVLPNQTVPAPAQPDGRVSADAGATAKDPRLDVPFSLPANTTQTGLVSKAAIPEKEAKPEPVTFGISAAERTLKPYGINMLPEPKDAEKQKTPPQDLPL